MTETLTTARQRAESIYQIQTKSLCIASLALAADLVLSASSLPTQQQRENVALGIMIAVKYLAEHIGTDADMLDQQESGHV